MLGVTVLPTTQPVIDPDTEIAAPAEELLEDHYSHPEDGSLKHPVVATAAGAIEANETARQLHHLMAKLGALNTLTPPTSEAVHTDTPVAQKDFKVTTTIALGRKRMRDYVPSPVVTGTISPADSLQGVSQSGEPAVQLAANQRASLSPDNSPVSTTPVIAPKTEDEKTASVRQKMQQRSEVWVAVTTARKEIKNLVKAGWEASALSDIREEVEQGIEQAESTAGTSMEASQAAADVQSAEPSKDQVTELSAAPVQEPTQPDQAVPITYTGQDVLEPTAEAAKPEVISAEPVAVVAAQQPVDVQASLDEQLHQLTAAETVTPPPAQEVAVKPAAPEVQLPVSEPPAAEVTTSVVTPSVSAAEPVPVEAPAAVVEPAAPVKKVGFFRKFFLGEPENG